MEQIVLGLFYGLLVVAGLAGIVLAARLFMWLGGKVLAINRDRGHDQGDDTPLQHAVAMFVFLFGILVFASIFIRTWFGDSPLSNMKSDFQGSFGTGFVAVFFVVMIWAGFWEWRRINHVRWTKQALREFFAEEDQHTNESPEPTDSAPHAST